MDQTIPQGVGQVLTPSLLKWLQVWLNTERLEAAAVVITFVSMVTGLALSTSNPSASTGSYVIAYIAGGIFGVQAAAKKYFNKNAKDLTAAEAAQIAACLPNPKRFTVKPLSGYVASRYDNIMRQMSNLSGDPDVQEIIK